MTTSTLSVAAAEQQLSDPALERLVRDIGVPPQPAVIAALRAELGRDDPDLRRVAAAVASDAALTAAVLRTANSPAYGLTRRAETLGQALAMLGLRQVGVIVSSIVLRRLIPTDGPRLTRFWDVSAKRAWALSRLARGLRGVDIDIAQTFGLFCDVGIPLLMRRFPDYGNTLQAANASTDEPFTAIEGRAHGTDHALIGALMARSWGVSQTVCLSIRLHHDMGTFRDPRAPEVITRLLAMALLAERAIQEFAGLNSGNEWAKGGDAVAGALMLSEGDVLDWIEQLVEGFSEGLA